MPKEHSKKWGGDGAFVDLTKGCTAWKFSRPRRAPALMIAVTKDGGLMYLTWRPPKEKLKGVESRVLKDSTRSSAPGACTSPVGRSRDGAPVAVRACQAGSHAIGSRTRSRCSSTTCSALTAGQPAGTTYTWTFPEGATLEGEKVRVALPRLPREQGASSP